MKLTTNNNNKIFFRTLSLGNSEYDELPRTNLDLALFYST